MSSPFGDDAEHPNRPDTLDFWRLSQVTLGIDASVTERPAGVSRGDATDATMDKVIDRTSVAYFAMHRAAYILHNQQVGPVGIATEQDLVVWLATAYIDGFVAGALFEREGGHRDG